MCGLTFIQEHMGKHMEKTWGNIWKFHIIVLSLHLNQYIKIWDTQLILAVVFNSVGNSPRENEHFSKLSHTHEEWLATLMNL